MNSEGEDSRSQKQEGNKLVQLYKDLGFDSLMYVSLIVDIEKVFGIEIKLEELEECLSVKKLIEIAQAAWEKK